MAQLTSTIVKGSVNVTGKIKSKGYVLPTIISNGEAIPLLELTVIGNDLYIDTHQAKVVINSVYGSGPVTLTDGTTRYLFVVSDYESAGPAVLLCTSNSTSSTVSAEGQGYIFISHNPGLESGFGILYDFSMSSNMELFVLGNFDQDAYNVAQFYCHDSIDISEWESYGGTVIGHFFLKDGKWYQDV